MVVVVVAVVVAVEAQLLLLAHQACDHQADASGRRIVLLCILYSLVTVSFEPQV